MTYWLPQNLRTDLLFFVGGVAFSFLAVRRVGAKGPGQGPKLSPWQWQLGSQPLHHRDAPSTSQSTFLSRHYRRVSPRDAYWERGVTCFLHHGP